MFSISLRRIPTYLHLFCCIFEVSPLSRQDGELTRQGVSRMPGLLWCERDHRPHSGSGQEKPSQVRIQWWGKHGCMMEASEKSEVMFDCNETLLGRINRTGHFEGEVEKIPNLACLVAISWWRNIMEKNNNYHTVSQDYSIQMHSNFWEDSIYLQKCFLTITLFIANNFLLHRN